LKRHAVERKLSLLSASLSLGFHSFSVLAPEFTQEAECLHRASCWLHTSLCRFMVVYDGAKSLYYYGGWRCFHQFCGVRSTVAWHCMLSRLLIMRFTGLLGLFYVQGKELNSLVLLEICRRYRGCDCRQHSLTVNCLNL
jgi:hypothetical protein